MIELPDGCPRGLNDCEPLARIEADDRTSFICCGHNDGTTRLLDHDRFRVCWKNDVIDEISDWDEADILDTISVLGQAMSADNHMRISRKRPPRLSAAGRRVRQVFSPVDLLGGQHEDRHDGELTG